MRHDITCTFQNRSVDGGGCICWSETLFYITMNEYFFERKIGIVFLTI